MGPMRELLCQRINYGQEFVKNCKTDVANERLYLRNLDKFALSIVLYCIGDIIDIFRIALNSGFYNK